MGFFEAHWVRASLEFGAHPFHFVIMHQFTSRRRFIDSATRNAAGNPDTIQQAHPRAKGGPAREFCRTGREPEPV